MLAKDRDGTEGERDGAVCPSGSERPVCPSASVRRRAHWQAAASSWLLSRVRPGAACPQAHGSAGNTTCQWRFKLVTGTVTVRSPRRARH
jgi:hypothetical protein